MPFSNQRGDGFENQIAKLVARDLHRPLEYFWLPQRRGFIRNSLNARRCDVVMGVPAQYGLLQPTKTLLPIHLRVRLASRSSLAHRFVRCAVAQVADDRHPDQPATTTTIPPPRRSSPRGTSCRTFADSRSTATTRDPIRSARSSMPWLTAASTSPSSGVRWPATTRNARPHLSTSGRLQPWPATSPSRFTFDIAMGVRRDDTALRAALDGVITRRGDDMRQILRAYGVPLR